MPPRGSLPAIKKFYKSLDIGQSGGIYEEFAKIAPRVKATPHICRNRRHEFHNEICKIIGDIQPQYECAIALTNEVKS
jgi:hypothetical protein